MRNIQAFVLILCLAAGMNIGCADTFYDFSDEAQAEFNKTNGLIITPTVVPSVAPSLISPSASSDAFMPVQTPISGSEVLKTGVVFVPKGTVMSAMLNSNISSAGLANNDRITAQINKDWVVNGVLIAPEGSIINGNISDVKNASMGLQNGEFAVNFNQIMLPDGKIIHISSNKVYLKVENNKIARIGVNAGVGALSGALLGTVASIGSDSRGKVILASTLISAALGAGMSLLQKGEDVEVPEGAAFEIRLAEPLTVEPYPY